MIIDTNNCREIHCGNGTIAIGLDETNTKLIIWEKDFTPVGSNYSELDGKDIKECNVKSLVLNFDGKDRIKTVQIIQEELMKIHKQVQGCTESDN